MAIRQPALSMNLNNGIWLCACLISMIIFPIYDNEDYINTFLLDLDSNGAVLLLLRILREAHVGTEEEFF